MKELFIVRHSEAEPSFEDDKGRSLSLTGQRMAVNLAEQIKEAGYNPDVIVCSVAKRATETLDELVEKAGLTGEKYYEDKLYLAFEPQINEVVDAYQDYDSVMIIGHNSSVSRLSSSLTRKDIYLETCQMAVIDVENNELIEILRGKPLPF